MSIHFLSDQIIFIQCLKWFEGCFSVKEFELFVSIPGLINAPEKELPVYLVYNCVNYEVGKKEENKRKNLELK